MLIINRTPETLTNLTVELATMGVLKIVERPQQHTIGPLDERTVRANIKVSSTETGHIFGTIAFDNASTARKTYVHLNEIQLDIMDYIRPGECKNEDFRTMWAEFEWENKVTINTTITDLQEFLDHIIANTNMTNLSPVDAEDGGVKGANFLAANLYARSVFGEDALVNLSVEKRDDGAGLASASTDGTVSAPGAAAGATTGGGKLTGYIRIRSKTQGIALSLGDRITIVQRSSTASGADGAKP
jgi:coatomer subunit beta